MFAENIKVCLTEILKRIFLINKTSKFKTSFFFLISFSIKMLLTVIKYEVSGENQKVQCSLSQASHNLKEDLSLMLSWDG